MLESAIGLGLFCWMWWIVGQILWMGAAMGGASDSDVSFIWVWSFGAVFCSPASGLLPEFEKGFASTATNAIAHAGCLGRTPEAQQALATPDEKLARLVRHRR